MRMEHLVYLACPRCGGSLTLEASSRDHDGHVMHGSLDCSCCKARYPLDQGVPRLLPDRSVLSPERETVAARFGYEWNRFCDFDYDEEVASLRTWFQPRRLEDLSGLVVLEAGCGMGRHAVIATNHGAKTVIGLDLGTAVQAAFQNTRHLPSVSIVQGDIYFPPFKDGAFDAAYSLGVLHHLPDPRRGFHALARKVKKTGWFQVWVYGREGNGWIVHFINPIRSVTSRIPLGILNVLSWLLAVPLLGIARFFYQIPWLSNRLPYSPYIRWLGAFSIRKVHAIVLDHALTPVAHYMSRSDVLALVEHTGWAVSEIVHNRSMSWGLCARHCEVSPAAVTSSVGTGALETGIVVLPGPQSRGHA
jgi:SAM-dependent methyltransferase